MTWPMFEVAQILKEIGPVGIEGFGLTDLMPEDENLGTKLDQLGIAFVGSYFAPQ